MSPESAQESFTSFKNSFHYGKRSDLAFKWLERLPDEEAAEFFAELLTLIGDMLDSGDTEPIARSVYEWNVRGYSPEFDHDPFPWANDSAPFTPLSKPVAESKIALFTSSGHFLQGRDPEPFGVKDMSQEEAARRNIEFARIPPVLCEIPAATPSSELRVRHPGYDVSAARQDHNCVFPLERLRELTEEKVVGELADPAYSFIGSTSQIHLRKESIPEWILRLKENEVDAVLLVPV